MTYDYRPRLISDCRRHRRCPAFEYNVEYLDNNGDRWRFSLFAPSLWDARVAASNIPNVISFEWFLVRVWRRYSNSIDYVRESWTRKQI